MAETGGTMGVVDAIKLLKNKMDESTNTSYEWYEAIRKWLKWEKQIEKESADMRDPNRISKYCDKLKIIWSNVPDWRFGQLMCNLLGEFSYQTGHDPFFPEDKELFDFFEKFFNNVKDEKE